jgi:hypothetical protein
MLLLYQPGGGGPGGGSSMSYEAVPTLHLKTISIEGWVRRPGA